MMYRKLSSKIGTFIFIMFFFCAPLSVRAGENVGSAGYIGNEDWKAEPLFCCDEQPLIMSGTTKESRYITPILPEIRNQGIYNTCWAVATLSLLEINMLQQGYSDIDYSDMHLAYYSYYSAIDPIGGLAGDDSHYVSNGSSFLMRGGNYTLALSALSDWLGAADESLVLYNDESADKMVLEGLPDTFAYRDVAYLEDYYIIDANEREEIKKAIVDLGAVAISYYTDLAFEDLDA